MLGTNDNLFVTMSEDKRVADMHRDRVRTYDLRAAYTVLVLVNGA